MSFKAKYRGHCDQCDEAIVIGDDVEYDDDELLHTRCLLMLGKRKGPEPVCQDCFTVHAPAQAECF